MSVVDFEWPLENGVIVRIDAEVNDDVVSLGISFPADWSKLHNETLRMIQKEMPLIEQHAATLAADHERENGRYECVEAEA